MIEKCRKILKQLGEKWDFFIELFLRLKPLSSYDRIYKNKVL